MGLSEEIADMMRREMEGDPLLLEAKFGESGERPVTNKEVLGVLARIHQAQNRAILRLADEINKLAG
jgi:hypothetical protein